MLKLPKKLLPGQSIQRNQRGAGSLLKGNETRVKEIADLALEGVRSMAIERCMARSKGKREESGKDRVRRSPMKSEEYRYGIRRGRRRGVKQHDGPE